MQYLRKIRAVVNGRTFEWDGTRPAQAEGIRIRFDVHQKDISTPNFANIIITNLKDDTSQVAFYENKQISLYAGYPDNFALIFSGQIRQARNLRENVTDKVLHILATDMGTARNTAIVNTTLKAGHTFRDRVDACFKALGQFGVKPGYIAKLPDKKFPRAFGMHGMAKDLLRDVCTATGSSWSTQNGTAQLLNNGLPKPGGAIILNSHTGLVGLPVQTIQGVEGRCLLNPRLTPGCLVQIDQKSIQRAALSPGNLSYPNNALQQQVGIAADGFYKIFYVGHEGDARGPNFYTDFIGVRRGDGVTPALASRGITDPDTQSGSGSGNSDAGSPANTGSGLGVDSTGPTVEVGPIVTDQEAAAGNGDNPDIGGNLGGSGNVL